MFWTIHESQQMIDGTVEVYAPETVSELVEYAKQQFPHCDCNFHRQFAFLTHRATQSFLRPMLLRQFGSIDAAKTETLAWLDALGSLETLARSTRARDGKSRPSKCKPKPMPDWYVRYLRSGRYKDAKLSALQAWQSMSGSKKITCSVNARHAFEVWHHRDYARLGEGDEFRFLTPLCKDCHASISARGPRVPAEIPEGVKQWL